MTATTKQVREVKLGDGREHADEVVVKTVELSAEEQEHVQKSRAQVSWKLDFQDLAEQYLSKRLSSEQRAALEERAQAVLSLFKAFKTGSERLAEKPGVNAEERRKREEARAQKEAERKEKEDKALAENIARLKHLRSLRPADIHHISWFKARELHFVDGGSGGVILVDLQDSCVVLKRQGKTAGNEMIAESVADAIGVSVAHVRVVKRGDAEYHDIVQSARCMASGKVHGIDAAVGLAHFSAFGKI